jgi:hypothetical protein
VIERAICSMLLAPSLGFIPFVREIFVLKKPKLHNMPIPEVAGSVLPLQLDHNQTSISALIPIINPILIIASLRIILSL